MASQPPPLPPDGIASYCQGCRAIAPTKYVTFVQHIGAIILMFNRRIKGRLCRNCVNEQFAKTTLMTTFFGWWGMISFFVTPIVLAHNIIRYVFCLSLKRAPGLPERGTGLAILAVCAAVGFPSLVIFLLIMHAR